MGRSTLDFNMQELLVVCLTVVVGLASGQEEGNTVGAIPGQAGRDYPNFQEIPESSFSCRDLSPGFYADPEGECQVYHRCTHGNDGPSFTRLCPIGTLYNQQYFVCDWWFNVDCSTVTDYYGLNDDNLIAAQEAGK